MKKIIILMTCLASFAVGAAEWTKGEIRRVDVENKKVTIKHEEIKSLDMAPMSMVFNVETTEVLNGINHGDQVEFVAEQMGTKLFAKQFRKIP
jgi:Cu/Ag efflux protein CusF